MNPQAMLSYLLGVTEGLVMYSIYSDYANKLNSPGKWKVFDINEDGYVPKSYNTITAFTGVRPDTVKSSIERLVKKGLLQKKPGNKETNNIPLYRPEFKSSVFIKIAEEKLKTSTANKLNQQSDKEVLPQIIETLEKDQDVMIALGLIKSSKETISQESKSPEEEDLNIIVEHFKWQYEDIYDEDYNPKDREIKELQKIINNYSMKQWGEMIPIFIERYNERWKSSEYPKPTIFGLTRPHILEGLKAMCSI
jgi:predicted transcriptional regulator